MNTSGFDRRRGYKSHLHLCAPRKKRQGTELKEYWKQRKKQKLLEADNGDPTESPHITSIETVVVNDVSYAVPSEHYGDMDNDSAFTEPERLSETTFNVLREQFVSASTSECPVDSSDKMSTVTFLPLTKVPLYQRKNDQEKHSLDLGADINVSVQDFKQKKDSIDILHANESESIQATRTSLLTSIDGYNVPIIPLEKGVEPPKVEIEGVRMVQMDFFLKKLVEASNHNPLFGCSLQNLLVIREMRKGLSSIIVFRCNMCHLEISVPTNELKKVETCMDINTRAVAGIMSIGSGFSHLEEFCASVGIPCMSSKTYSRFHDKVCEGWEKAATHDMEQAHKMESTLAIERGEIDSDGVPVITVVADGCWSKRSYKSGKHDALSGVAAIVGFNTRKVLFMAVRNKFCFVCSRTNSEEAKPHVCYKNWSGSSSSMESNIIVEGFKQSEALHNVRYGRMIADGDSSCYKKILEARPYKHLTVEKIECRNHLLRNYISKIKLLTEQTKLGSPAERKLISGKQMKFRCAVTEAIKYQKNLDISFQEKVSALKRDIENGPNHIFGEHTNCAEYFCNGTKENERNIVPQLKESGLYQEIQSAVKYLSRNCRSLILDVDSNSVEQFNAIVAKHVGAKRVNFSMKRSYQGRCAAAVVSHNTKRPHYVLHKTMYNGVSPNKFSKRMEMRRAIISKRVAIYRANNKGQTLRRPHRSLIHSYADKDYGPNCQQPDMNSELYKKEELAFLASLQKSPEECHNIERGTLLQAGSGQWLEMRRKMITASNFGNICRRRPATSCKNIVKNMLYTHNLLNVPSLDYGRKSESTAITQLERQEQITVDKCGLFIDKDHPFLGATPDGIIGEDGLVEVKCPLSASGMNVNDAVLSGKIKYLEINKEQKRELGLKKTHEYYFQVQGQLHVTQRQFCLFAIWTSPQNEIKVIRLEKDDYFWKTQMEPKLIQFYFNCMLPELVDPRHTRNMEIRDPTYIVEAQRKKPRKQN